MSQPNKQAINGRNGEDAALSSLAAKGYKILDTNYRSRFGEIDIVARDGDTVIFVEVKSLISNTIKAPSAQVDSKKQVKLAKTALQYISENDENYEFNYRFDVIEVLNNKINHIESAFDMPEDIEI